MLPLVSVLRQTPLRQHLERPRPGLNLRSGIDSLHGTVSLVKIFLSVVLQRKASPLGDDGQVF